MKLIEILPTLKFFHGKEGVDKEQILAAQEKLGLSFSSEYKELLEKYGVVSANGHEIVGLGLSKRLDVVDNTLEERKLNPDVPMDIYVVEQTGVDGIVIWQDGEGKVYQTSPYQKPKLIFNSLAEYIAN